MAAEGAVAALADGDTGKRSLWRYNVRFMRELGHVHASHEFLRRFLVSLPDESFDALADELERSLGVDVLPDEFAFRGDPDLPALTPIDPDSGALGVSLSLREITEVADDEYEAIVSYARSGLDGGDLVLVLERSAVGWSVAEHFRGSQG